MRRTQFAVPLALAALAWSAPALAIPIFAGSTDIELDPITGRPVGPVVFELGDGDVVHAVGAGEVSVPFELIYSLFVDPPGSCAHVEVSGSPGARIELDDGLDFSPGTVCPAAADAPDRRLGRLVLDKAAAGGEATSALTLTLSIREPGATEALPEKSISFAVTVDWTSAPAWALPAPGAGGVLGVAQGEAAAFSIGIDPSGFPEPPGDGWLFAASATEGDPLTTTCQGFSVTENEWESDSTGGPPGYNQDWALAAAEPKDAGLCLVSYAARISDAFVAGSFTIDVAEPVDNRAPVIVEPQAGETRTSRVGEPTQILVTVVDDDAMPDSDMTVTLSKDWPASSSPGPGETLTLMPSDEDDTMWTGEITINPAPSEAGTLSVALTANDGEVEGAEVTFTLEIIGDEPEGTDDDLRDVSDECGCGDIEGQPAGVPSSAFVLALLGFALARRRLRS